MARSKETWGPTIYLPNICLRCWSRWSSTTSGQVWFVVANRRIVCGQKSGQMDFLSLLPSCLRLIRLHYIWSLLLRWVGTNCRQVDVVPFPPGGCSKLLHFRQMCFVLIRQMCFVINNRNFLLVKNYFRGIVHTMISPVHTMNRIVIALRKYRAYTPPFFPILTPDKQRVPYCA